MEQNEVTAGGGAESVGTVVIGGGQAGLAAGYHLARRGERFVILDAAPEVGHAWRSRWDSLRLFTPARNSALPGLPLPGPQSRYPGKDEIADYLRGYVQRFGLPVRSGTRVERLRHRDGRFAVTVRGGGRLEAQRVIVATGISGVSWRPPFAGDLDPVITQLHSCEYQRPGQLQDGPVLVVGAGNSGAEIALELSRHHQVYLAGRGTGAVPVKLAQRLDWLLLHRVLTESNPAGRQFYEQRLTRGHPWLRVTEKDFGRAGLTRLGRVEGVRNGLPVIAGGEELKVANIVWSTGYRHDYTWLEVAGLDGKGSPRHHRGIAADQPGLYFVGLPFQHSVSSALIGGAGRDAGYVVGHALHGRR